MKTQFGLLILFLLLNSCNQQPEKPVYPKGELAFLLQYHNRLPTDVGFLTNHIVARRVANLMKENFILLVNQQKEETPLVVDSIRNVVKAVYTKHKDGKQVVAQVTVDVANDAVWVDYFKPDTVLQYADRPSLIKP